MLKNRLKWDEIENMVLGKNPKYTSYATCILSNLMEKQVHLSCPLLYQHYACTTDEAAMVMDTTCACITPTDVNWKIILRFYLFQM